VCAELIQLLDVPEFRQVWLDYCELYNATPEEQQQRLGAVPKTIGLQQGHSRLTAYAARLKNDPALARRAWAEFNRGGGGQRASGRFEAAKITGPAVLRPVAEAAWVSSNGTAQWGLAAIECLALVGEAQPAS
ncbi:MAG: Tat pathway signal sequence domain protein, partial [Oleiharenicola lentus]